MSTQYDMQRAEHITGPYEASVFSIFACKFYNRPKSIAIDIFIAWVLFSALRFWCNQNVLLPFQKREDFLWQLYK